MDSETPRQKYLRRHSALKTERATWDSHWKELSDYIQPRRSRFFTSERNSGTKKHQNIINSTATRAARVLAAGMMAGLTSPAREWFRLTTPDPELAEAGAVRGWLHVCQTRLLQAFARSNIYKALANVYLDVGTPGTSVMLVEDDPLEVFRAYVLPIGSYCLSANDKGEVDTVYRDRSMTVRQMVERFTEEKCSASVRDAYKRGAKDEWREVVHVLEPNTDYQQGKLGAPGMKWRSCWFEAAVDNPGDSPFLLEAGYEENPALCPRWATTGEDVYGHSPGMEALGDARALQVLEKRKAMALEKIVNPPMKAPTSLLKQRASLLPGDVTYVSESAGGQKFEPAHVVDSRAVEFAEMSIRQHEQRINAAYYADLWLMLANSAPGQMTATEVAERHEEKMLQLGPVLEQLEDELLEPLIERGFAVLLRNGDLPPPPPELEGVDLRVEYLSIMAQAQKMIATAGIERFVAFSAGLAAVKPEVLDKVNTDEVVDDFASAIGIKPDLVNTDEQVAAIRAQRAQAQAMAQQQEAATQAVEAAKNLSDADTSGDNLLTRTLGGVAGGVAGGSGGLMQ